MQIADIVDASVRLHDFIRANAGETKDWPLQISSDDPLVLETLDRLLNELRIAVTTAGSTSGKSGVS